MTGFRLLEWLSQPSDERGIRFARANESWEFFSYGRLAALARRSAWRLRANGVGPDSVVLLAYPNSPEFVGAFFGCLMLGGTPAPIAPPARFQAQASYHEYLSRIMKSAPVSAVSTTADLAPWVAAAAAAAGARVVVDDHEETREYTGDPVIPEIGLLQFSSGSVGSPRGAQLSLAALQANIDAIQWWTGSKATSDALCSWAPLYHDMGLTGCLLVPMSVGGDIWLMEPEQFVRSPLRWLRCFGEFGATITAVPNFGLRHVLRRVTKPMLAGMDFSGWRSLIMGSERVDVEVIERFTEFMAPLGFSDHAVMPAYGLAEATLAVTGSRHDEPLTRIDLDPASLVPETRVRPQADGVTLVGCGRPLPGISVAVVDDEGRPLEDGVLGEIEVRSPSLALGYVGGGPDGERRFDGVLRTGDAGFLLDDELFVVGRIGDSVKIRGRWLFAENLDQAADIDAAQRVRSVVLLGSYQGRDTAVVLAEGDVSACATAIGTAVANHASDLRVIVLEGRRGAVLRTTSGKPRRRAMWERFVTGGFAGVTRWDSDHDVPRHADA